jgi:hypothetical protein
MTLRDYLKQQYSYNQLADIANYGCSGGVSGLIYTSDCVALYEEFKYDCHKTIIEYQDMTGEKGFPKWIQDGYQDYDGFANSMIWFAVEWIAQDITAGEYQEDEVTQ